jgi:hypothetical protein
MPAGQGAILAKAMTSFLEAAQREIPRAFVLDRGGHLVVVDLPGREVAEVHAGRVVGTGHRERGERV